MTDSKKRALDWSRCAEGFSDFMVESGSATKTRADPVKRKSSESFGHGNIFDKLFSGIEEDKSSQSIAWSSSEDEKEKKEEEKITPVVKKTRRSLGKTATRRSKRTSNIKLQDRVGDDTVEIVDAENDFVATSQPSQDGISIKSEDLLVIGGFDSDTEENKEKTAEQAEGCLKDYDTATSQEISESSVSPVTQMGTGLKASDWVKSLQLKTPSKSDNQSEKLEHEDSAKKRKKHSKGGLAEQLARLQSRDKSAVRMWYHQQSKPSLSQDSKSAEFEMIGYDSLYSMQLVKCKPVHSTIDTSSQECSVENSSADLGTSLPNETRLVMFPASQAEQLSLQVGSRFKIYPPWQQLELNDGQQVLLCTKYCTVVESLDTSRENRGVAEHSSEISVSAKWNCPCVQGLCRNVSLCPAYQFPVVPGFIQESNTAQTEKATQEKLHNPTLLKSPQKSSCHLHTISAQSSSTRSKSLRGLQELTVCDSLLKSIEACRTAVDGGGDGYSGTVSFTGHIHRAVVFRLKSKLLRCCFLVEDKYGTVCEVQLNPEDLQRHGLDVSSCENRTFQLSGLSVLDRFTRDKHNGMFTMIDHVWSGKCTVGSQDSRDSQDILGRMEEPPGFCYILHQPDSSQFSMQPCASSFLTSKPLTYTHLSDVWKIEAVQRISCVAKLFYMYNKANGRLLYISDESLRSHQSFSLLHVSEGVDIPETLLQSTDRTALVMRDLLLTQGEIHADKYSRISVASELPHPDTALTQELNKLKSVCISVNPLDKGAMDNDLCLVEGQITDVDEDSAYSWEACVHCDGEQLHGDASQGSVQCLTCKKTMSEPVTRMKMEVVVRCDKSNICPAVDLLQETIESLLPTDEADDEGYELSSVLNKKIGPLHCVVVAANGDSFKLREIRLLK